MKYSPVGCHKVHLYSCQVNDIPRQALTLFSETAFFFSVSCVVLRAVWLMWDLLLERQPAQQCFHWIF